MTTTETVVLLSDLLRQPVREPGGRQLGRLADLVITLPAGSRHPTVRGLVLRVGDRRLFIGADRIADLAPGRIRLATATADLRPFERRRGEVLLRADVLGHRMVDLEHPGLVRAHDAALTRAGLGWAVTGIDLHRGGWRRLIGQRAAGGLRDWSDFEALIGHQPTADQRGALIRLRRLKPAHLADLLEEASPAEQQELLTHVHGDPELEADVFEELDDEDQTELLTARSDTGIAAVLARMSADDAADALLDLPQARRRPVLDALPGPQRDRITALLGYAEQTAGGLMTPDYLAVPAGTPVVVALEEVRAATDRQPQALTGLLVLDEEGRLTGLVPLVRALQAGPDVLVDRIAETDPVRVRPAADALTITRLMADHNLLVLPVVDDDDRPLGVVTVDDALEAAIPTNWRRREAVD